MSPRCASEIEPGGTYATRVAKRAGERASTACSSHQRSLISGRDELQGGLHKLAGRELHCAHDRLEQGIRPSAICVLAKASALGVQPGLKLTGLDRAEPLQEAPHQLACRLVRTWHERAHGFSVMLTNCGAVNSTWSSAGLVRLCAAGACLVQSCMSAPAPAALPGMLCGSGYNSKIRVEYPTHRWN